MNKIGRTVMLLITSQKEPENTHFKNLRLMSKGPNEHNGFDSSQPRIGIKYYRITIVTTGSEKPHKIGKMSPGFHFPTALCKPEPQTAGNFYLSKLAFR